MCVYASFSTYFLAYVGTGKGCFGLGRKLSDGIDIRLIDHVIQQTKLSSTQSVSVANYPYASFSTNVCRVQRHRHMDLVAILPMAFQNSPSLLVVKSESTSPCTSSLCATTASSYPGRVSSEIVPVGQPEISPGFSYSAMLADRLDKSVEPGGVYEIITSEAWGSSSL